MLSLPTIQYTLGERSVTIEQQLLASGRGCMSVVIVGNKGHEVVREVWEGDNWSDGMGNTGTEEVQEV